MVCKNCGTKNIESSKFCKNCGRDLYETEIPKKQEIKEKINKKPIFAIIVLIFIIIFISSLSNRKSIKEDSTVIKNKFESSRPILVYDRKNYFYISSKNGKKIFNKTYKKATNFYGKYAIVRENGKYEIIDLDGNAKYKENNEIKFDSKKNIFYSKNIVLDNNLKTIAKSEKNSSINYLGGGIIEYENYKKKEIGIINLKGKITYKEKINNNNNISIKTNDLGEYCAINYNDTYKSKIINCNTSKTIYEAPEKKYGISPSDNNIFNVYNTKYIHVSNLYIENNKVTFTTKKVNKDIMYYNGYILLGDNTKYNLYESKTGKKIKSNISINDAMIDYNLFENYQLFGCKNKNELTTFYGIKKNNSTVLKCEWADISIDFTQSDIFKYMDLKNKKYFITKKDGQNYLIDAIKNKKLKESENNINYNNNSIFVYSRKYSNDYKKIDYEFYNMENNKSKTISFNKYSDVDLKTNYFVVTYVKDDKYINEYYNSDFKLIYSFKY